MSEDLQALIDEAVKKALAGDDEAINGIEDRVTRSKAKAALVKAKREQSKAVVENSDSDSESSEEHPETDNIKNIILKIAKMLGDKFSGCIDGEVNSDFIQLKPKNWFQIAKFLKEDPNTYFDSLQSNTGFA